MIERRNRFLFVNLLTKQGKKHRGETLLLKCLKKNQKTEKTAFLDLFSFAVKNTAISFKSEKFKKTRNLPKTTLIFLTDEKDIKMKAIKELLLARNRQLYLTNQKNLKQEDKILFALKESINSPENFTFVTETYETLISQKKYAYKFKWAPNRDKKSISKLDKSKKVTFSRT